MTPIIHPRNPRFSSCFAPGNLFFAMALAGLLAGCGGAAMEGSSHAPALPAMETRADSVAMKVFEAYGGQAAWAGLRYLRFDFATGSPAAAPADSVAPPPERTVRRRHLWDRMTGEYRLETPGGGDTLYVALFNTSAHGEGSVWLFGERVGAGEEAALLEDAYRSFINDTYWLLMPVKLFDEGVRRTYLPDSSRDDTDVLHLSFGDVGLTPGDQYWVYSDKETGHIRQWAYRLQHHAPDHAPQPLAWSAHKTFETPSGALVVSEQKASDAFVLFTDRVDMPADVPEGAFADPQPFL